MPQRNQEGMCPCFDHIPMTYSQLLSDLIQRGLVDPKPLKKLIFPISEWFNPNVQCEFHAGTMGYPTEDCIGFKIRVQNLIDIGQLTF